MIDGVLDTLSRELRAAGVPRRLRTRVGREVRDHLLSATAARGEFEAVAELGDPREIALEVAGSLATARGRLSAVGVFGALVLAGASYVVVTYVVADAGWPDIAAGETTWLGIAAAIAIVLLPQIAFACGSLTVLTVLVTRGDAVLPSARLLILRRRAISAALSGAGAMGAFALWVLQFRDELSATSAVEVDVLAALALAPLVPLAATSAWVLAAARTTARHGAAGATALDELAEACSFAPVVARVFAGLSPWRFAVGFAVLAGVATLVVGWIGEGPASGIANAVPETVAILGCFALLRRPLALAGSADQGGRVGETRAGAAA